MIYMINLLIQIVLVIPRPKFCNKNIPAQKNLVPNEIKDFNNEIKDCKDEIKDCNNQIKDSIQPEQKHQSKNQKNQKKPGEEHGG